jgi:hypothetical protein
MTASSLFVELVHRLQKHTDASVLSVLLADQADVVEVKTSAGRISMDRLGESISRLEVHRALKRLSDSGLISVRIHANTRTHVTVDRAAVLALLQKPLPPRLPGLVEREFPFLDVWRQSINAPVVEPATVP